MSGYERVILTEDVFFANGQLRVAQGAIGSVVGADQGVLSVVFDPGQATYVAPGHNGRPHQEVPRRATKTLFESVTA